MVADKRREDKMSEKNEKKLTGDPRIDYKWFSRCYETSEAHFAAQDAWRRSRHSAEIVAERHAERASRTPAQQITLLDQRLGIGQGAVRERAKLSAK